MTKDVTALDILKAARSKIAKPENWGKGLRPSVRPLHTCCAGEAIDDSPFDTAQWPERRRARRTLLCAAGLDSKWGALEEWNDARERTHADVIAAYNLAIACLRLS